MWPGIPGIIYGTAQIPSISATLYFNAIVPQTMTVSKIIYYPTSTSASVVDAGIYKGSATNTSTSGSILVGESSATKNTADTMPQTISIFPTSVGSLSFTAGDSVVVAFIIDSGPPYLGINYGVSSASRWSAGKTRPPGLPTNPTTGTQLPYVYCLEFLPA